MIKVDASLCIGCLSCSNVCPSKNIVRTETKEFCPAKALTLVPLDESVPESDLSFDLVACRICGSKYATEPMLKRIESVLPANLQKDSDGLEWIRVCPTCRQRAEAERVTRQLVAGRRRKSP
jgi:ferredoxin